MALLWTQAMAWHDGAGLSHDEAQPVSVRSVGFKGYVGGGYDEDFTEMDESKRTDHEGFDEDLYDRTTPEPTAREQAHHDKHGEHPESFYERHNQAYAKAMEDRAKENEPDHENEPLHTFIAHQGSNEGLWKSRGSFGKVNISGGVWATQSHVSRRIMDEHQHDPSGGSWQHRQLRSRGYEPTSVGGNDYLGHDHPMFVTHGGKLHCTEGHHRVAVALQRGSGHVKGWHYDADKHGLGPKCGHCGYTNDPDHEVGEDECENCGKRAD